MFVKLYHKLKFFYFEYTNSRNHVRDQLGAISKVAGAVGCHIFDEDFKVGTLNFQRVMFFFILFFTMNINSVIIFWGNLPKLIFSLSILGFGIQGLCKVFTFVRYRDKMCEIRGMLLNYHAEVGMSEFQTVRDELFKCTVTTHVLYKMISCLYLFVSVFMIILPTVIALGFGFRFLPFGIILPIIDAESDLGYGINFAVHLIITYLKIVGLISSDGAFVVFFVNAFCQIEVIILQLAEIDNLINYIKFEPQNSSDTCAIEEKIRRLLGDCIRKHEQIIKLTHLLEKLFKMHNMVLISTNTFTVTVALYAQLHATWYQGYACIMIATFQMLTVCTMGTILEVKNDQLIAAIYNMRWYMLPVPQQKSTRLLLKMAQEPLIITYGLGKLNLPSFVSIYKGIYSYFMVLKSFN